MKKINKTRIELLNLITKETNKYLRKKKVTAINGLTNREMVSKFINTSNSINSKKDSIEKNSLFSRSTVKSSTLGYKEELTNESKKNEFHIMLIPCETEDGLEEQMKLKRKLELNQNRQFALQDDDRKYINNKNLNEILNQLKISKHSSSPSKKTLKAEATKNLKIYCNQFKKILSNNKSIKSRKNVKIKKSDFTDKKNDKIVHTENRRKSINLEGIKRLNLFKTTHNVNNGSNNKQKNKFNSKQNLPFISELNENYDCYKQCINFIDELNSKKSILKNENPEISRTFKTAKLNKKSSKDLSNSILPIKRIFSMKPKKTSSIKYANKELNLEEEEDEELLKHEEKEISFCSSSQSSSNSSFSNNKSNKGENIKIIEDKESSESSIYNESENESDSESDSESQSDSENESGKNIFNIKKLNKIIKDLKKNKDKSIVSSIFTSKNNKNSKIKNDCKSCGSGDWDNKKNKSPNFNLDKEIKLKVKNDKTKCKFENKKDKINNFNLMENHFK